MTAQPASPRHALVRRIIIDLAAMTVIGVFLAIIGPFGSIAAPLPERLVTWIGFAWLGYACYRPMQSVATWGEHTLDLPRWGVLTAAVLVGTLQSSIVFPWYSRMLDHGVPLKEAFRRTRVPLMLVVSFLVVLLVTGVGTARGGARVHHLGHGTCMELVHEL